jgi:hypothetical protein
MQTNDYKKSASAFIHGIRYNAQTLCSLLEEDLKGQELPAKFVPLDARALLGSIFERIEKTSSLWHMYDSLCDAYILDRENSRFIHLRDMPVRMLAEDPRFGSSTRIEFRFTFKNPEDPVEQMKFTNIGLLHPVISIFKDGKRIADSHTYEDVYAEWERESFGFVFQRALDQYFDEIVAA